MRLGGRRMRLLFILGGALALGGVLAGNASASELIANVQNHSTAAKTGLKVNSKGIALLTYKLNGKVHHILAKGAINARPPVQGGQQTEFKLDYKGGWGFFRNAKWWQKKFGKNKCGPYQGDDLPWLIKACTMPDGSHWAVQSWQRRLLTYGQPTTGPNRVWEIRLSHWNTELPVLEIQMDWQSWGDRHYDHLWGRYTYLGNPVYGFKSTRFGAPLDKWGRNVYLDTFNSAYGSGWRHENAFLTHDPTGNFCYVLGLHGSHPSGMGEKYRATVVGPGVAPDVTWEGVSPGEFDPIMDEQLNLEQQEDLAGDGPRWQGACDIR